MAGSISGKTFFDNNGNNLLDGSDAGIASVAITLKNAAGASVASTTTDAQGHYSFANVAAGTYTVNAATPSGQLPDSATPLSVAVAANAVTGQNIGFYLPALIGGQVCNDLDRDGTRESNEAFLIGVTINLLDMNGAIVATTTSVAHPMFPGAYGFTNIRPGSYQIQAVIPGEPLTQPLKAVGQIQGNQQIFGFNIATVATPPAAAGSIAGTVFVDANADSAINGSDAGIAAVLITLNNAAGATVGSTTTDAQGHYSFGGLAVGNYTVNVATPSGQVPDTATPLPVAVVASAVTQQDLGFYTPATISGQIYNDLNHDGMRESGEAFMIGVKLNLLDMNGTVVATTTSAANPTSPGIYTFANIKPGNYQIQAVIPGEPLTQPLTPTGQLVGNQSLSNFNAAVVTTPLAPGNASIAGTAFLDADADNALDHGETGMAGVNVALKTAGGRTVATTTTDAQGHYSFSGLPDDSYKVLFSATGFLADNGAPQPVTVANQASVSGVNAGFFQSANIEGTVTLASTGAALDGITLQLLDATGRVVDTTISYVTEDGWNTHGAYTFYNIVPGTYTVQAVIPNAVIPPLPSASIVLTSGQFLAGNTISNVPIQSLAQSGIDSIVGVAFVDTNGNGQQDSGEAALANLAVTVKDAHGVAVGTAITDVQGQYHVNGLIDGLYSVSFGAPAGGFTTSDVPVRLSAASPINSANGAFFAPASVSGIVFNDADSNGVADSGDGGLGGVTVRLLDASGATAATTTTGGNGAYNFTSVKPGTYFVQFVTPNGDVATTPTSIDLHQVSGGQGVTANAGFHATSGMVSLSGTAFLDANANGVQDGNEAGLAHVNAVLISSAGTAVQTVVTDANGHYAFSNVANGTYSVTFATPSGDTATTPTTVQAGILAAGASRTGLDAGFAPDPTPVTTGALPASTTLNIILRGQSNSAYFVVFGMLDKLQSDIETMLGFDGVHQKVNILGTYDQAANGTNTINGGTAMIGQWLTPVGGDYHNGWQATNLELGLLSAIAQQPDFKSGPTAVIWLHNESDSINNPNVTSDEWASAARFEAGLVRGVLGQSADTVPYLFVNAIPFPSNGNLAPTNPPPPTTVADQQIRIGMAALSADPTFNGHIVAQSSDVNMDANGIGGYYGGLHNDGNDSFRLEQRLARSLADAFSASALPGSPLSQAGGHVDSLGPQVISAATVAGHADQLLLTVQQDAAITFEALGTGAAQGLGWSLRGSAVGSDSALEASGVAVSIIDATHVLVTFDTNIQAGSKLFYGWGSARIAPDGQPGTGNAIYDNNHLPIWADANGLGITNTQLAVASTVSGVAFLDTNGSHLADNDESAIGGLAVTLKDSSGTTVGTTTTDPHGAYSFAITTPGTYSVTFTPPASAPLGGGTESQTVIVANDQNVPNVNAGFYAPATIYGLTVDAVTGIFNGVTVELLNAAGTVVGTTLSSNADPLAPGVDGVYSFDHLAPGIYSVRFTAPSGKMLTTPAVNNVGALTSGQMVEVDGHVAPSVGSIAGTVFIDNNANNLLDGNDSGIASVAVTLKDAAGASVASTTTDAQGHYSFASVVVGSYTVNVTAPSGQVPDSTTPLSVAVTTGAVTGQNVGFYTSAAVHGQIYNDLNHDGVRESAETFIVGVQVNLLDLNGNIVATTTSAPHPSYPGIYAFDNVRPGNYQIQVVIPGEPLTQPLTSIGLSGGQLLEGLNASAVITPPPASTGSIAGTIFLDANADSVLNGSDAGIASVVITLKNAAGASVASTTTDAQGHYSFGNLAADTYTVNVATPSGKIPDSMTPLAVAVTTNAVTGQNVGFYMPAVISGVVFTDANNNGAKDGIEAAVDGITVNLLDAGGHVVATTVSAGNNLSPHGAYEFDNVKPGIYTVQPIATGAIAHSTGPLTGGQSLTGFDFGLATAALITDIGVSGPGITNGNGLLSAGAVIAFTATFDSNVTVDTTNGTPTLMLSDGTSATYASGSGTSHLVFTATVGAGENSSDLAVTGLNLHGATMRDIGGTDALLAGAVVNPAGTLVIDTTKPMISLSMPASHVEATSLASAAIGFSGFAHDAVDGTDAVMFKEGTTVVTSGQMFGIGAHTITASATDAAGNAADPLSFGFTVSDTTKPLISLSMPASHVEATSLAGAAVSFSGFAHDAIDGTDAVMFKEGTTVVTSGQIFGAGAHTITASAADAAGNAADPLSFGFTVSSYYPMMTDNFDAKTPGPPVVPAAPVSPLAELFDHFDQVDYVKAYAVVVAAHLDPVEYFVQQGYGNGGHAWLM